MSAAFRAVVLGGAGHFGAVISRALAAIEGMDVVVAGRDAERAREHADRIGSHSARIDTNDPAFPERLRDLAPSLVVSTAGPFQGQDYAVARAAIALGAHYIDIADGRDFVCGIRALDAAARERGVVVVSGASSVPTLSAAVVDHLARDFAEVRTIDFGITTSARPPGAATIAAALGSCGKPVRQWRERKWESGHGWQGVRSYRFTGLERPRWFADCDVPDLELLPQRYPTAETVRFGAGSELIAVQAGLWSLGWAVRSRLLRDATSLAAPLGRLARLMESLGSGRSAMFVKVDGIAAGGAKVAKRWEIVAANEDGARIPCMAAVCLARKLARGTLAPRGAMSGAGLVTLEEYLAELAGLQVRIHESALERA